MLVIGQCTKEQAKNNCRLNGCPPTKEEMFEFLQEHLLKPA
jgi:coenzyme F420-reducing hydrogenase gamma subunit